MYFLDNTPNQSFKSRIKNCVEINDDIWETYNINSQIQFKTKMLKLSLFNYSDVYILVERIITVANTADNANKKVIFKNCVLFTDCTSKINNTKIDNAKDIDVVMPRYNLIEHKNNYSKT